MGHNPIWLCLMKRGNLYTDRHEHMENGIWRHSRDHSHLTIHEGTPLIVSQLSEPSRTVRNKSFPHSPERSQPCQYNWCHISGLQNSSNKNSVKWLVFHCSTRKMTQVIIFAVSIHLVYHWRSITQLKPSHLRETDRQTETLCMLPFGDGTM